MKKSLLFVLVGVIVMAMLVACGAPNTGAKDVISNADHKQHEINKAKKEGGD